MRGLDRVVARRDVDRRLARHIDHGILMEHVTVDGDDAPQLKDVSLDASSAAAALDEILDAQNEL